MEISQENQTDGKEEPEVLAQVLLHRHPNFNFILLDRLSTQFRLLDPNESTEPLNSFLSRHAQSVRALVCIGPAPITSDFLHHLPSLELIVASNAGVDHIDLTECRRRSIAITNASSAFSEPVADYAVALLIDVLRRLSASDRYVRSGLWPHMGKFPLGFKIGGRRIGIVGLGNIGSEIAKRLEPFGCSIAYNSRKKKPSVSYTYYDNVHDLAVNSDVLVVCCGLTDKTRHIINGEILKALGKKGVLVNVGRGSLVDEKELVQFLIKGELGGAGLDVFEDEPNVPRDLFALDTVVLSPHYAGAVSESFEAMYELIVHNLMAFFSNKPLKSLVNLEC